MDGLQRNPGHGTMALGWQGTGFHERRRSHHVGGRNPWSGIPSEPTEAVVPVAQQCPGIGGCDAGRTHGRLARLAAVPGLRAGAEQFAAGVHPGPELAGCAEALTSPSKPGSKSFVPACRWTYVMIDRRFDVRVQVADTISLSWTDQAGEKQQGSADLSDISR